MRIAIQLPVKLAYGQGGRVMPVGDRRHNAVATCFPVETLLLALNRTHVDYFSLDVEGLEMEILESIPWDRLNIMVLSVEYRHVSRGKQALVDFMKSRGYKVHADINNDDPKRDVYVQDYIFVRQ